MGGTPSMGHQARFGAGTTNPVANQFEFLSCDFGKRGSLVESPGMRGTRSHYAESVNDGPYTVGGTLVMEPRPDELDHWLPFILGKAAVGDTFALAETIPDWYAVLDKVAAIYLYSGMKVNQAIFESAAGQNLRMSLACEGKTEGTTTFPDISATLSELQPYIHHQCVLTLDGESVEVKTVRLTVDNALVLDMFNNSQTRTAIPEGDRVITLTCENPFTSYELDLYDLAIAGVAGSLVYTNGDRSLTFTMPNLKAPAQGPAIGDRNTEIPLVLNFTAFKTGTDDELTVTNDAT